MASISELISYKTLLLICESFDVHRCGQCEEIACHGTRIFCDTCFKKLKG